MEQGGQGKQELETRIKTMVRLVNNIHYTSRADSLCSAIRSSETTDSAAKVIIDLDLADSGRLRTAGGLTRRVFCPLGYEKGL